MQNSGDSALALAVDANERELIHKFEIDWNRNGLYTHALSDLTKVVTSIRVNRDVNSSLPAETTIVEGYMTAQMNVTLSGTRPGDTDPIARLLSPWNVNSSLFGDGKLVVPVRADLGHRVSSGAETLVRQFTGIISNFRIDSRSGEIQIECLDPADALGAPINLPLFALEEGTSGKPIADWRINSQWVIDYILRRNGIYMSPPPHSSAIYSNTCHGAPIPEIGHMAFLDTVTAVGASTRTEDDPVTAPGRPGWGLAYGGDRRGLPIVYARGRGGFTAVAGSTLTVQAQIDTSRINSNQWWNSSGTFIKVASGEYEFGGFQAGAANRSNFGISTAGQPYVNFYNGGSETPIQTVFSPGLLPLTGYQNVWYRVVYASPLSGSSVVFSTGHTVAVDLSTLNVSGQFWPFPCITFTPPWPMHDVQVCNATGLAVGATLYDPTTWVPQADLDAGLLTVSGLPLRRGADSWDLLKEVVGAEYGVAGFNEAGRFFFVNRENARRGNLTLEKTITNDRAITDFALSERTGSVRNTVTTKLTPRFIAPNSSVGQSTATQWEPVFKLVDPNTMVCGPGSSAHQIRLDVPAWTRDASTVIQNTSASWPPDLVNFPDSTSRFVAVRQNQIATEQAGVLVTITTLPPDYGLDQILLQVFNPGIYPIIFATTDGDPAFWLMGRKYRDANTSEFSVSRASSVARYGNRTLELPDSDWRQQERSIGSVARSLLKDLKTPVPVIENLTIVGDCRLQLQDTVSVQDDVVLGGPMFTTVSAIDRQYTVDPTSGGAKLVDSLNVRPFAPPGKWILGHSQWSILGQTTKL